MLKDQGAEYQRGYAAGYRRGMEHKGRPRRREPDKPVLYPWIVIAPGGRMFGSYKTEDEARKVAATMRSTTVVYEHA